MKNRPKHINQGTNDMKQPALLPIPVELVSDQQLDLASNPQLIDLKFKIEQSERIGLRKNAKDLHRQFSEIATALILKKHGFMLIKIVHSDILDASEIIIRQITANNDNTQSFASRPFRRYKLKDYVGEIPNNLLINIPDNFANKRKVHVFEAIYKDDPIIAYHLKDNYYVGLWQWE